jgi:ElaB/YqjD/DUF883 family membrane-anchored ribosome-binding protein
MREHSVWAGLNSHMESHFPVPAGHQSALARQRLMDDLSNLVNDAELLLRATADDVNEKTREARQRLVATLERAKAAAAELRRRTVNAANQVDALVRDHPYESILTAVTVGAVVGFLFARGRSSRN